MKNLKVGDVKIIKPSIDSSQETMNELLFQVVDAINELKDYTLVQPEQTLEEMRREVIEQVKAHTIPYQETRDE